MHLLSKVCALATAHIGCINNQIQPFCLAGLNRKALHVQIQQDTIRGRTVGSISFCNRNWLLYIHTH